MFWVIFLGCQEIKGQTTIFSQNFESNWTIPSTLSSAWTSEGIGNNQWHMNSFTTGWTFPNLGEYFPTGANGTNKSARFHSYGASSGSTGSLISPTINFPASNCQNKNLSFNIINTDGVDKVNVYISTDGGTNWGSTIGTFGNYSNWTLININLGTTTSNNVKVKFVATSDWGLSDIGIDEIVISSNTIPSTVSISPASATICSGSSKPLTASGGDVTGVSILSENFNGAAPGWTNTNTSTGGIPANATWTLQPNNYNYTIYNTTFNSNDNSQFYLSNSDAQGLNSITNTTLVSPSFSTLGFNAVSINFFQYYNFFSIPEYAKVEVSIDNSIWNTLTTYISDQGSNNNFVAANINLPATYLNQPTVYIRFNYSATWDFYWAIDNVTITGNKSANFTWSPNVNLSTTIGTTVIASPTTTQTYTATSTINGCSNSTNVTVTVNPINTIVLTSGNNSQTVCLNSAITNITYTTTGATGATVTGLPNGFMATWANNVVTISGITSATGIFNYTITLTGGCGSITTTGTITVNSIPNKPGIITGNPNPCSNTPSLIYSITAVTGATSYSWAVPTGWSITSGQGTTSITVTSGNTSQNGLITVSASNICGTSSIKQLSVTVSSNTAAAASSSPSLCVNSALTNITHTTTGASGISNSGVSGANGLPSGVSASWSSNTITINGTPTASGTFNYSIPLTGGCGNVNATGTIMVNTLPVSTASNNGPYCSGSTIQLIGSSGLNYYSWNGPNNYSSSNQLVTQNFDSLGTGTTWTDNSTLSGWYLLRNIGTVNPISSGTGSNNTGAIYNFTNSINSTDRALGSLGSNATGSINYGVKITNATGFTVNTVSITYTGEQYRDAGNTSPVAQSLTFDYSTNATNLTTASGAWTPVPALTFSTPTYTITAGVLDGNATSNRVVGITSTITGLSIPNGSNIWVRWTDLNDSNNDAAVAIDDVSIVLSAGNSSPSIINATTQMSGNYSLNVVDSNGCNSTATTNVVVNPVPNITISGNATICAGASTTLSATGASSYLWSNSLGINPSINVTPSSNTQYTVTGTNSYNCTNNASINVTVNPNPSTTLIYHQ
ncbi:hypothetical protein [Flavobacterium sp.]|jgi:hypothetical protein|uniref:hypothetical protein n=1 Tax=Flavobacterium sp. TaxID=239 RepID=UPI0037C026EA